MDPIRKWDRPTEHMHPIWDLKDRLDKAFCREEQRQVLKEWCTINEISPATMWKLVKQEGAKRKRCERWEKEILAARAYCGIGRLIDHRHRFSPKAQFEICIMYESARRMIAINSRVIRHKKNPECR